MLMPVGLQQAPVSLCVVKKKKKSNPGASKNSLFDLATLNSHIIAKTRENGAIAGKRPYEKEAARRKRKSRGIDESRGSTRQAKRLQKSDHYLSKTAENAEKSMIDGELSKREKALQAIAQFRDGSSCKEIMNQIECARSAMGEDIESAKEALSVNQCRLCGACGRDCPRKEATILEPKGDLRNACVEKILKNRAYYFEEDSNQQPRQSFMTEKSAHARNSCLKSMKAGKLPNFALEEGWMLDEIIPEELSKYEALLISLRLPSIPIWRKNGYQQRVGRRSVISYANPLRKAQKALSPDPRKVFSLLSAGKERVSASSKKMRNALNWLIINNSLRKDVVADESNLTEINSFSSEQQRESSQAEELLNSDHERFAEEALSAVQTGPLDNESLEAIERQAENGVELQNQEKELGALLQCMLSPYEARKKDAIPSRDAADHLEEYFPALFPRGKGGPRSIQSAPKISLRLWAKLAIEARCSRHSQSLSLMLFLNAALRKKGLSGLASNAPLFKQAKKGLKEIRELVKNGASIALINYCGQDA